MKNANLRQENLTQWVAQFFTCDTIALIPLVGDASFRRYFRCQHAGQSYIVMDAPPALEDCQSFVSIAKHYAEFNLSVPQIFAEDLEQGFLIISDLGDRVLLPQLNAQNSNRHYQRAFRELMKIQAIPAQSRLTYPRFDYRLLRQELDHFTEWLLQTHLQLDLSDTDLAMLDRSYDFLIQEAHAQPQVCVHRDYHSRNLMLLADDQIGIIDFQDAVWGPITYDLVSLIRDCYIDWPADKVDAWLQDFYTLASVHCAKIAFKQFQKWFNLMGLQRHLKAMFIFARKFHRDHCPDFLNDIPRTFNYALAESEWADEVNDLHHFLKQRVAPLIKQRDH